MTKITDTVTLLFNTPITPPRPKKHTTDIPLMELLGGRRIDRRLSDDFDPAQGVALADLSLDSTRTSIESRGSSTAPTQPSN